MHILKKPDKNPQNTLIYLKNLCCAANIMFMLGSLPLISDNTLL